MISVVDYEEDGLKLDTGCFQGWDRVFVNNCWLITYHEGTRVSSRCWGDEALMRMNEKRNRRGRNFQDCRI